MGRQEWNESERENFWLHIDEFQNFVTPSMAAILSGALILQNAIFSPNDSNYTKEDRRSSITSRRLSPRQVLQCLSPESVEQKNDAHKRHFRIIHFPCRTSFAIHLKYCRGVKP